MADGSSDLTCMHRHSVVLGTHGAHLSLQSPQLWQRNVIGKWGTHGERM